MKHLLWESTFRFNQMRTCSKGRSDLSMVIAQVDRVRNLRNSLAHVKPLLKRAEEDLGVEQGELAEPDLTHKTELEALPEVYFEYYKAGATWRDAIMQAANLTLWDLITRASVQDSVVGFVD